MSFGENISKTYATLQVTYKWLGGQQDFFGFIIQNRDSLFRLEEQIIFQLVQLWSIIVYWVSAIFVRKLDMQLIYFEFILTFSMFYEFQCKMNKMIAKVQLQSLWPKNDEILNLIWFHGNKNRKNCHANQRSLGIIHILHNAVSLGRGSTKHVHILA